MSVSGTKDASTCWANYIEVYNSRFKQTEKLERFEPSPERAEERECMRQEFLDRIFYIFQEEAEDTDRGDTEDTYEEAVNISAT